MAGVTPRAVLCSFPRDELTVVTSLTAKPPREGKRNEGALSATCTCHLYQWIKEDSIIKCKHQQNEQHERMTEK